MIKTTISAQPHKQFLDFHWMHVVLAMGSKMVIEKQAIRQQAHT
jgi:hypothetical protein